MPQLGEALVKYEDDLKRKLGKLTQLIVWNNEMRLSIHVVFVNIFRPQLRKIDLAFKPGLSQIQWLSKDFDSYIDNVEKVQWFAVILLWFSKQQFVTVAHFGLPLGYHWCQLLSKTGDRSEGISHWGYYSVDERTAIINSFRWTNRYKCVTRREWKA